MRTMNFQVPASFSCWCVALVIASPWTCADEVRLNQIQVIGTHNSYHVAPRQPVMDLIANRSRETAQSLDYTHPPFQDQLCRLGIRQIELDIFADPEGGLYAEPQAEKIAGNTAPDRDPLGLLKKPGMKILHVQDVDYRTRALTLVQALQQVRVWSRANPSHCPVLILIEVKQESIGQEFTQPHRFGPAEYNAIDSEILSVFQPHDVLKPDDIRGELMTLREAVTTRGWPLLDDVRGKVVFALDNEDEARDAYLEGHPSLRNRLLFVSVDATHQAAAFMKINNCVGEFDKIQRAVQAGFLVRTRADSGTKESRLNESNCRDRALASGAQFVSTDYPEPDRRFSTYQVRFKNQLVARGNPVNGQAEWRRREFDPLGPSWSGSKRPTRGPPVTP